MKRLCEEQKLSARDALEVSGLKDMQYRVLKIMGDNIFDEEEKSYVRYKIHFNSFRKHFNY